MNVPIVTRSPPTDSNHLRAHARCRGARRKRLGVIRRDDESTRKLSEEFPVVARPESTFTPRRVAAAISARATASPPPPTSCTALTSLDSPAQILATSPATNETLSDERVEIELEETSAATTTPRRPARAPERERLVARRVAGADEHEGVSVAPVPTGRRRHEMVDHSE